MKPKDLGMLVVAVVIFLVAGYVVYTQIAKPKGSSAAAAKTVKVEVVGEISSDFDTAAQTKLSDASTVQDFTVPLDLTTGLNNQAVFGAK